MIEKIRQFFAANLALEDKASNDSHALQLAAAALLIEVSKADYQQDDIESIAIHAALLKSLDVSEAELEELLQLAEQESKDATSVYQFTRLINDNYTAEQKTDLLKSMWQVAYADHALDKHEEHLIRKIADLIYVPHREFIRTKLESRPIQGTSD
jgi:uncharacterized tellurite resistance protein B-like protein